MSNPLDVQVGGQHYKDCKIQPVEFMHANGMGYCEGAVVKYITRYKKKNGLQDLLKARHFIDLLISLEYPDQAIGELQPQENNMTQGQWVKEQFEDIRILVDRLAKTKINHDCDLSVIQLDIGQQAVKSFRARIDDLEFHGLLSPKNKEGT